MNNRPEFFWLTADNPRVEQCYALRKAVFVDEQGFENEFDEIDSRAWHLLAVDGDAVLAAARVFFEDEPGQRTGPGTALRSRTVLPGTGRPVPCAGSPVPGGFVLRKMRV